MAPETLQRQKNRIFTLTYGKNNEICVINFLEIKKLNLTWNNILVFFLQNWPIHEKKEQNVFIDDCIKVKNEMSFVYFLCLANQTFNLQPFMSG